MSPDGLRLKVVEILYEAFLALPFGSAERLNAQALMSGFVDFIARSRGQEHEAVQVAFENAAFAEAQEARQRGLELHAATHGY